MSSDYQLSTNYLIYELTAKSVIRVKNSISVTFSYYIVYCHTAGYDPFTDVVCIILSSKQEETEKFIL